MKEKPRTSKLAWKRGRYWVSLGWHSVSLAVEMYSKWAKSVARHSSKRSTRTYMKQEMKRMTWWNCHAIETFVIQRETHEKYNKCCKGVLGNNARGYFHLSLLLIGWAWVCVFGEDLFYWSHVTDADHFQSFLFLLILVLFCYFVFFACVYSVCLFYISSSFRFLQRLFPLGFHFGYVSSW